MELKAITLEMIPNRRRGRYLGNLGKMLLSFMESDTDASELIDWQDNYSTFRSAYTSIKNAAKALNIDIIVAKRGDRMFLIKKESK